MVPSTAITAIGPGGRSARTGADWSNLTPGLLLAQRGDRSEKGE